MTNHSPVTYRRFSSDLVLTLDLVSEFTTADKRNIQDALVARGLIQGSQIDSEDWLGMGTGVAVADDPLLLRGWLSQMGGDPSLITPNGARDGSTLSNAQLDPGEVAALWFDLENRSEVTAGGVLVTVTSLDNDLRILDGGTNIGYMTLSELNETQVMYSKVNGTAIVSAMTDVPSGNTYFKSNPFYNQNWRTAVWVQVKPLAPHGKTMNLQVRVTPSNGVTAIRNFPVTLR